jgi:outer membrane receptor protein involved in Fe transport
MNKNLALVGVLFTLTATSVLAQSAAGLGGLTGTVRDASGAAVPAAQVVVANEAKGIKRAIESNEAGVFTASALQPADGYTISVSKTGFANWEAKDIKILVGQVPNFNVVLQVATSTTMVEVSATAQLVDSNKTDVSQVVNSTSIMELPINGRRVDSFVLTTPAVIPDGTFGLVSFRGIAGGNSFLTDGNDTTEQYYNENVGRTRITSQISQDAVQEFQVVSNNYSAEFGRATGGVVNTITRSGTNEFHGTGYWFFRNQDFNARDFFATINPEELRNQYGVSAGGKIIANKLFYFANYEGMERNFPLLASITAAGNPLFNSTGQFIGTCAAPATADQCNYAINFLNRQFQTVPRTTNQNLGFFKLDFRPNERNTFSASLNLLRWVSPLGLQTQAVLNNGNGVGNNVNSSARAKYGTATWTNIPAPTLVNEARFGWFADKQFDYPNNLVAIPNIGFLGVSITGQSNLGTATDYPRTNPSENRYSFADTLNWTKGKHTLKVGFDWIRTEDYTNVLFNRTGTYLFSNFTNLALSLSGNVNNDKTWQTFTQTVGNPVVDFYLNDMAFFVQDQWKISPRLTVNLGIRYDKTFLPQPTVVNPDYPATGRIPTFNEGWAPRGGITYSLDESGKTVIRAGYGMFIGRYPGGLINTFMLGNGLYQKSITLQSNSATDKAAGPVFPNVLPTTGQGFNPPAGSVSLNMAVDGFRTPYTQQANLGIERQLTDSMVLTASYLWSLGLHLTSVQDINIGMPGPTVNYRINDASGNWVSGYSTPVYVRQNRVDTRYNRVNIVDHGMKSYYDGLVVQLQKRLRQGLQGSIAYTWSHSIDDGQGNAGTPNIFASGGPQSYLPGNYNYEKGNGNLDIRQRIVMTGVWTPVWSRFKSQKAGYLINGWQLSGIFTWNTPPHVSPTLQISSAYVPAGYTVAQSAGGLNGYASTRVPFQAPGSLEVDTVIRLDTRITKNFMIKERYQALFTFDAFNLFNHPYFTSIATREYTYSLVNGTPTLNPASGYYLGTATQGFPDGTNARRLQLGLRFIW